MTLCFLAVGTLNHIRTLVSSIYAWLPQTCLPILKRSACTNIMSISIYSELGDMEKKLQHKLCPYNAEDSIFKGRVTEKNSINFWSISMANMSSQLPRHNLQIHTETVWSDLVLQAWVKVTMYLVRNKMPVDAWTKLLNHLTSQWTPPLQWSKSL